jgi:hypothetical protein
MNDKCLNSFIPAWWQYDDCLTNAWRLLENFSEIDPEIVFKIDFETAKALVAMLAQQQLCLGNQQLP